MKTRKIFALMILVILAAACTKELDFKESDQIADDESGLKSAKLNMKIAVMSDLHLLDPSLMTNDAAHGDAFQTYLNSDPKLIEFSSPILKEAIAEIIAAKPDILLIPGDLTKDGEKASHRAAALLLKQISDCGIKVFVIPGNHDVNNPEAVAYNGNGSSPTPTITAAEFASIYTGFGYRNAICRDRNSLSYICQPYTNIWILAIDDCKYYENVPGGKCTTSGIIKPSTMTWIQNWLALAKLRKITVLAMMHHGLVEHYAGQDTFDPGYLTDNSEINADALTDAGMKVLFTGHEHANDISMHTKGDKVLFDIETGSLVTNPSPFRMITMDPVSFQIETRHITSIDATLPLGSDFATYSNFFFTWRLDRLFTGMLSAAPYNIPAPVALGIAPRFRNALMAHFAGDEQITPMEQAKVDLTGLISPQLKLALQTLWTDLPPSDNQYILAR